MAWSQFYAEIKGRSRTPATRCGNKDSGIQAFVASKTGAFLVKMENYGGKDVFEVRIVPWCNSKFDEIPILTGNFVEGENSPVLRLDDKTVQQYIHDNALEVMTK